MFNKIFKKLKFLLFVLLAFNISTNLFSLERKISLPRSESTYDLRRRSIEKTLKKDYGFIPKHDTPTGRGKDKEFRVYTPTSTITPTEVSSSSNQTKNKLTFGINKVLLENEKIGCSWYMENSEKNEFDFEKEVKFFNKIKHPNIVEYNGYLKKSGHLCIFTEPGDFSLHDYIFDDNTDKETTKKIKLFKEQSLGIKTEIKILKDIASVIAYIHSLGYVHRDIKPKNVVLFANGTAKLIDFTSYEKIPTGQDYVFATGHTLKGTTPYKAPENLRDFFELNNKYEKAQDIPENEGIKIYPANDIFAYGILMHDLLYKDNIVNIIQDMYEEDLSEMDFVDIILGDQENKPFRPELDNNLVHEALNNLLNKCWDDNPDNRPTAKEIVEELERIEQEI